jgi:hypothetical protein
MFAAWMARAMKARKEVLTNMIVIKCCKKWEVAIGCERRSREWIREDC